MRTNIVETELKPMSDEVLAVYTLACNNAKEFMETRPVGSKGYIFSRETYYRLKPIVDSKLMLGEAEF